eukprot:TRINITY_DN2522_c0_g1_i7.p1 TRINITY_DN2522_c0_g1~~TRINITY_DN2522_c0_g1_i7.p1  ORF type:complete len:465 (-),score=141.26 TRINITY_DN2522_c0_g1_i7:68-1462(-)
MAPIILPFSVMYYGLAYLVIKQQLLCCVNTGRACSLWEPKEYDGAGTAMRSMINLTLFGLIMALVLNAAYFSIRESWPAAGACLAPIPFIVWKWCKVCSQFAQVEAHLLSNLEEQETKDPEPIDPRDLFSTEHNKDSLDCEQSHENPCFYQQPCLLKHHSCSYWSYAVMPPPAEQDKSPEPTKPASTNSWFSHAAVEVVVPSPRSRASSDTPCVDGCDCVKCVAGDDVAADLIASEVARASLNPEELGRSAEEQEEDELARMIAEAEAIAEQAEAASVTPMGSPVETEPVVAAVAAEVEHPIESVAAGAAEECAAESADTAEPTTHTAEPEEHAPAAEEPAESADPAAAEECAAESADTAEPTTHIAEPEEHAPAAEEPAESADPAAAEECAAESADTAEPTTHIAEPEEHAPAAEEPAESADEENAPAAPEAEDTEPAKLAKAEESAESADAAAAAAAAESSS